MKLVLRCLNEPPDEVGQDLSVVIMGEDMAMARAAAEMLKPVELNCGAEGRLIPQLWHPDFLIFNELRELAAMAAAAADIVVVSVRAGKEMPGMLQLWMKRWLDLRPDRPGALVAVLDSGLDTPDAAQDLRSQLKAAAVRGNMDFFVTWAKEERDEEWAPWRNTEAVPGNSAWRRVHSGPTRIAGRRGKCSGEIIRHKQTR